MNSNKCLWYRCRQCGAVFADGTFASGNRIDNRVRAVTLKDYSPFLFSTHDCDADRLGLADLIGSGPTPATANQVATL
jgi:hypothetical protein